MEELTPAQRFELHIAQHLLNTSSLDVIGSELVKKMNSITPTLAELEVLSVFLLYAGQYVLLNDFLIEAINRDLQIPWALLCESLFLSSPAVPNEIRSALLQGAEAQGQLWELARSSMLDDFQPQLEKLREQRKSLQLQDYAKSKEQLLGQAELLKTQGLLNEESKLLEKMKKIFPRDEDVQMLLEKWEEKKADGLVGEIKHFRSRWIPLNAYITPDPATRQILENIEQAMQDQLKNTHEEMSYNFAIAHIVWDNYEIALRFLEPLKNHRSAQWLRLEVLLLARKFVELLTDIQTLEVIWVNDPETTFALLYLRAQALWELGQKQDAHDIMENIFHARPDYRSASSLVIIWKEKFR